MEYVKNNKAFVQRGLIFNKPSSDLYILTDLLPGIYKIASNESFNPYLPDSYGMLLRFEYSNYIIVIFITTHSKLYFRHGRNVTSDIAWYYDWKAVSIV